MMQASRTAVQSPARAAGDVHALVDLSFCLALIGGRDARLLEVVLGHVPGSLAISAVTTAALHLRAARSSDPARNRQALAHFLLPLATVDFDAAAAAALATLEQEDMGAGVAASNEALMVAAQAVALDAAIITCAPHLYEGLQGVRLQSLALRQGGLHTALPTVQATPRPAEHSLILAMGSHDLTLDLVGERLHAQRPGLLFCTSHVGSRDGLLALRRGEAHLAGAHLLDGETGEYNITQVRTLLGNEGCHGVVVGFVQRTQGLIVAHGNPKAIHSITDLARADITFVNRQPGAGTRVLLDHLLRRNGMTPQQVIGYGHEESSHTGVTAAIASGVADCGLGIQAAASAHNLGFVPLCNERYDLVIPAEHFTGALLAPLLALLRKPESDLLRAIGALGGYSTEGMGRVLAEF
jgi:molybdate-binding protein/predicted nucleic acid-binding protein